MRKPPKAVLDRVRRLARIAKELSRGANFSITRLTTLKSLCEDPDVAARFAVHLANRTSRKASTDERRMHDELIEKSAEQLESYVKSPSDPGREALRGLLRELEDVNDEYESVPYGVARVIQDKNVLILEDAVQCVLSPYSTPEQAYRLARNYSERYDPQYGTGLIPESAPLVMDIVDFWCEYYSIDRDDIV